MRRPKILPRRAVLAMFAAAPVLTALPAIAAADPAAAFVDDNINRGMAILNNRSLSASQKRDQFESFLLGLVDLRRIAMFTLGQYRRTAAPQDIDAFVTAFRNYAVTVYQSYFSRYSGQTLKVVSSSQRAPTDYIVTTQLIDPKDSSGQAPIEVDFRVRTDTGRPVLVDVAVAGIWLSLEERDQFSAFLGQNNGNIHALIGNLSEMAANFNKK